MAEVLMINLALGLFILAATAICVGCLLPAHCLPPIRNDKWMHFVAFASLAFMSRFLAQNSTELMFWFLGLMLAGLLIEILQHWVPGRQFCWRDLLANMAGIALIASFSFF